MRESLITVFAKCQKCVKICTDITIENNLSYIPDTVSPARFGAELAAACPTGAIVYKKQVKGERHDA